MPCNRESVKAVNGARSRDDDEWPGLVYAPADFRQKEKQVPKVGSESLRHVQEGLKNTPSVYAGCLLNQVGVDMLNSVKPTDDLPQLIQSGRRNAVNS